MTKGDKVTVIDGLGVVRSGVILRGYDNGNGNRFEWSTSLHDGLVQRVLRLEDEGVWWMPGHGEQVAAALCTANALVEKPAPHVFARALATVTYKRSLDPNEVASIETYLNGKYLPDS